MILKGLISIIEDGRDMGDDDFGVIWIFFVHEIVNKMQKLLIVSDEDNVFERKEDDDGKEDWGNVM